MISRRTALIAGAAGAGALSASVAACGNTDGPARTAPTGSGPAGDVVAKVADIPVGGAVSADAGGRPVIVSRPTAATVKCFSAICTHQGCTVMPQGAKLVCPCHGSVYNAFTGAVIQTPAPSPLPAVAVKVQHGEVVTG